MEITKIGDYARNTSSSTRTLIVDVLGHHYGGYQPGIDGRRMTRLEVHEAITQVYPEVNFIGSPGNKLRSPRGRYAWLRFLTPEEMRKSATILYVVPHVSSGTIFVPYSKDKTWWRSMTAMWGGSRWPSPKLQQECSHRGSS